MSRRRTLFMALLTSAVLYLGMLQFWPSAPGPLHIVVASSSSVDDVGVDSTKEIQAAIDHCSAHPPCGLLRLVCHASAKRCTYYSGALWLRSNMVFDIGRGVTLTALTDPDKFPFIYSRFEGTLRFGHAGLINAGRCLRMKWNADTASVIYPAYPGDGDMCARWDKVTNLTITGDGVLDGQGAWWWKNCFKTADGMCPDGSNQRQRPSILKLMWVDGLTITRLTLRNSPFWFIHPVFCNNVRMEHIAAVAPSTSRNTDGFDPDSCTNVYVNNCVFETGDDCVAIKSGRGEGAIAVGLPTANVLIENCEYRYGHGVTVGSEMSGGIRNVTFRNSKVVRTKVAFRIKTARGRGGVIEDILFENFDVQGTPLLFSLDMNYEKRQTTKRTPTVRNIIVQHVTATNVGRAGIVDCLPENPCTGITLYNISITGNTGGFQCNNAQGRESSLTVEGNCLLSER